MLILAFDTTLAACSAAVFDAGRNRLLAGDWQAMERGHAEALAGMVRSVAEAAGIALADVDRIAVTTGPGTFTGVRIGLAMARGLSLALSRPVIGLSSLEAISLNVEDNPAGRPLASIVDARRGEFYVAVYDARGHALVEPCAVAQESAAQLVPEESLVVGPGAERLMQLAGGRYERAMALDLPDAARIARAAAQRLPGDGPPQPLYLRPPGAKLPTSSGKHAITVAEATAEHAPVLAAMHGECFPEGWPTGDIARLMAMPGAVSYIASDGDEPAGFLIARRAADEAEIITLGTLPALRRRGIARRLVGRLAEALAAAGVRSLLIESAVGNAAALSLYQALGFTCAGTRPGYYRLPGGGREDAKLMRLGL